MAEMASTVVVSPQALLLSGAGAAEARADAAKSATLQAVAHAHFTKARPHTNFDDTAPDLSSGRNEPQLKPAADRPAVYPDLSPPSLPP
jgi:hypothetical protein